VTRTPPDNPLIAEFLDDYFAECDEHLTVIRRGLLAFESQIGRVRPDRRLCDELLRSLHTIKGLSGMVAIQPAESLSHQMESFLRALQDGNQPLTTDSFEALIAGTRRLEEVLAASRTHASMPDSAALIARFEALSRASAPLSTSLSTSPSTAAQESLPGRAVTSAGGVAGGGEEPSDGGLPQGMVLWRFGFQPSVPLHERGVNVTSVRKRLQAIGDIRYAAPRIAENGGGISFEFLVAAPADAAAFAGWQADGLTWTQEPPPETAGRSAPGALPAAVGLAPLSVTNSVRVDLSRLDTLVQLVGDLVISRSRLADILQRLDPSLPAAQRRALQETNQAIERQLRMLRDGVMRVRLVPISEAFARLQFIVRDLAGEQGKQIKLEVYGQETEIDKYLVERIRDPLLHLIRNAIGHGLEPAAERLACSKPAEGRITLRAATAGESVVLEVEDDGRGIDAADVAAQAHALGLRDTPDLAEGLSLLDILCLPGFTTRTQADRISGRGVGMDVVRSTIRELGGSLAMDSRPGRGTRFSLRLPLTLAIADALIAGVGRQTFAIPRALVEEVLPLGSCSSTRFENNEVILHRGQVLPLVRLASVLGLNEVAVQDHGFALVIDLGASQAALAVDTLVGLREIVVRTLTDPLVRVPGIVGATELGDGRAVLILDAPALIRAARQPPHGESRRRVEV
jgi:two-component system, chemotaxis family, sensor kinase CheA